MAMSGGSFVIIFFLTNVASVVFSALMFGAGAVAAHGACRVPDDLFVDDSDVSCSLLTMCRCVVALMLTNSSAAVHSARRLAGGL